MHLSSDSDRYFVRELPPSIGWRFHFDCSNFTHVKLLYLNIEPFMSDFKSKRLCKIYCNLVAKTITDPYGTLGSLGGTQIYPRVPGNIAIYIAVY